MTNVRMTKAGAFASAVRGSPDPAPRLTAGLPEAEETYDQALRRGQETCAERSLTQTTLRKIQFLGVVCAAMLSTISLAADSKQPGLRITCADDATRVQVIATLPPNV